MEIHLFRHKDTRPVAFQCIISYQIQLTPVSDNLNLLEKHICRSYTTSGKWILCCPCYLCGLTVAQVQCPYGVHVSSAARCLFPSQSTKQQQPLPITAWEAPSMTIRHHLQTLQLPPVSLLSSSVNYTNHFLQDGSLGCQPGNLSLLYLRLSDL